MTDIVEWLRGHKIQRYHEAAEMIEQLRAGMWEYACTGTDHPCGCYDLLKEQHSISYDYSVWPYEVDQ